MGVGGQGRPAKPTALKVLHGDRASRTSSPRPGERKIRPPKWLSREGRRLWRLYAPDLIDKEVLTPWDVDLFAHWCHASVRAAEAAGHINEEGEVIVTPNGRVKNPWFQVWRDSIEKMLRIGARFGLSPADRAQISVGGGTDAKDGRRLLS